MSKISKEELVETDAFKLIVAGSRTFKDYNLLERKLDAILKYKKEVVIISGMAKGADSFGIKYAKKRCLKWAEFPADWKDGKKAGYIRNAEMSEYANACVVFMEKDGTKGSQHMIDIAEKKGIQLRVILY